MVQASQTVLASLFNSGGAYDTRPFPMTPGAGPSMQANWRDLYNLLEAYYLSNGLYDDLSRMFYAYGRATEAMKPLRNPASRIVDFYVSKVWPGSLPDALPIRSDNSRIEEPIQRLWKWSNWAAKKQVASRHCATFGDMFIKVNSRPRSTVFQQEARVWLDLIKPTYVTEFETDEHDAYLTYVKIDVPHIVTLDAEGNTKTRWHTEVWSKDDQMMRTWVHDKGPDSLIKHLGTPTSIVAFAEIGIDFIPIAHAKFKDIGDDRGIGAFTLSLDKINEINRKATRLSQMLFRHNRALWAITANAMDKEGRPIPAPRFAGDAVVQANGAGGPLTRFGQSDNLVADDGDIVRLSGMSKIESLVPAINYEAARNIIQDDLDDLENDQPEMAYYRLVRLAGEMSGRALRYRLAPAIDRVVEVRGNMESALVLAHQMALTIGKLVGAFDQGIGTFEAGDFEHTFDPRDVIPTNDLEDAQARKTSAEAASAQQAAGVSKKRSLMENFGYGEDEIKEILAESEADAEAALARAQRAFDSGQTEPTDATDNEENDGPPAAGPGQQATT